MKKELSIEELNEQIAEEEEKLDRVEEMILVCDKKVQEFEQKIEETNAEDVIYDNEKMLDYIIASDAIITVLKYKRVILEQAQEKTKKLNAMYDDLWRACGVF
ncbi:MAG: hypothetical protein GX340_00275 [Clostridiales bacterium]|nr:hypothetical protein [Clostridiales bacterium]